MCSFQEKNCRLQMSQNEYRDDVELFFLSDVDGRIKNR